MPERARFHGGSNSAGDSRWEGFAFAGARALVAGTAVAALLVLPAAAIVGDGFVCQELKSAVADAARGFGSHKGALAAPGRQPRATGKTYLAKKSMTGASACSVEEAGWDEPTMRVRQTAYICRFPGAPKLGKALRAQLMRCVSGEVDEPSDPDEFTLWVDRVSSGEGYRGTEVNAQANAVDGLTLQVRLTVCTNKGDGQACEE